MMQPEVLSKPTEVPTTGKAIQLEIDLKSFLEATEADRNLQLKQVSFETLHILSQTFLDQAFTQNADQLILLSIAIAIINEMVIRTENNTKLSESQRKMLVERYRKQIVVLEEILKLTQDFKQEEANLSKKTLIFEATTSQFEEHVAKISDEELQQLLKDLSEHYRESALSNLMNATTDMSVREEILPKQMIILKEKCKRAKERSLTVAPATQSSEFGRQVTNASPPKRQAHITHQTTISKDGKQRPCCVIL